MAEGIIGNRERHSLGEESTYGSAVSPVFSLGGDPKFEPNNSQNFVPIKNAGDDDDIEQTKEQGVADYGGNLSFGVLDWRHLKFLTNGSSSVSDVDNGSYHTHTISMDNDVAPFTYERFRQHSANGFGDQYVGCQVKNYNLSWEASPGSEAALVRAMMEIVAQDRNDLGSLNGPSAPDKSAYKFRNVTFTLAGSEIIELIGGNMAIALNLNAARYANYNTLNRLKDESTPQKRVINGTLRVHYNDSTYFDEFDGTTVSGTNKLSLQRGTNDKLDATLTNFRIEDIRDPSNNNGRNEATIEWSADSVSPVVEDDITTY